MTSVNFIIRIGLISAFLIFITTSPKALACSSNELRTLIVAAQTLDSKTEKLAANLVDCPRQTAVATQWLSFYRSKTQVNAKPVISKISAKNDFPEPIGSAISRAYGGSYKSLKLKIDNNDIVYKEEPETSLAVGRMLARYGSFSDARTYYEEFLRSRFSSDVLVEYLYTFIWEGDFDRAEIEFRSQDDDKELAQAIQRGKILIEKLREKSPNKSSVHSNTSDTENTWLTTGLSGYAIKNQFRRYGNFIEYAGILNLSWHHHVIHSQIYDQATLNSDELTISKKLNLTENIQIDTAAHYVVHAKNHWGGYGKIQWKSRKGTGIGLGIQRHHLYADIPLAEHDLGLTRQSGWIELSWTDNLIIKSMNHLENIDDRYTNHSVTLRQQIKKRIDVFTQASVESRATPSAHYPSYRQTQALSFGSSITRVIDSSWQSKLEGIYTLNVRQAFGDTHFLRHSGASFNGEINTLVEQFLRLRLKLFYGAEETDRPTDKVEQKIGGLVALQFST